MGYSSNREPRRHWKEAHRMRVPCASCGAPARPHSADLPFCNTCLDWARQRNFDELGAGD